MEPQTYSGSLKAIRESVKELEKRIEFIDNVWYGSRKYLEGVCDTRKQEYDRERALDMLEMNERMEKLEESIKLLKEMVNISWIAQGADPPEIKEKDSILTNEIYFLPKTNSCPIPTDQAELKLQYSLS